MQAIAMLRGALLEKKTMTLNGVEGEYVCMAAFFLGVDATELEDNYFPVKYVTDRIAELESQL